MAQRVKNNPRDKPEALDFCESLMLDCIFDLEEEDGVRGVSQPITNAGT